jgi:hypothetical protein
MIQSYNLKECILVTFIIFLLVLLLFYFTPSKHEKNLVKSYASKEYITSPFKVAILPNELIEHGHVKYATIASINKHQVEFAIFTGDTKDGGSVCSDEIIGTKVINFFNKLNCPVLYSVGDSEWTDCHRVSNGSYDPLERLAFIRKIFFNKRYTQGNNPIPVERQGKPGAKFSENSRFIYHNIMFVALHVVGSNNNLVSTDKLCYKKSNRIQSDCDRANQEYKERNAADIIWLKESFSIARKKKLIGIVIVIQGDIYSPYDISKHGYKEFLKNLNDKNGFTDFFRILSDETHHFPGQVLLVHGDSHVFQFDKAMYNKNGTLTSNFWRVETFGGKETSWVELNIDPKSKNVFSVSPVILPSLSE